MKRSVVETLLGALVIVVAVVFLSFSYNTADVGTSDGFNLSADFSGIGGLKAGDDVVVSGVKVGSVTDVQLVSKNDYYVARVFFGIEDGLKLSTDTSALISSESLLGGRYLALDPGADDEFLEEGDNIQFTQAPQNLEQLLGQFIFSMNKSDDAQ